MPAKSTMQSDLWSSSSGCTEIRSVHYNRSDALDLLLFAMASNARISNLSGEKCVGIGYYCQDMNMIRNESGFGMRDRDEFIYKGFKMERKKSSHFFHSWIIFCEHRSFHLPRRALLLCLLFRFLATKRFLFLPLIPAVMMFLCSRLQLLYFPLSNEVFSLSICYESSYREKKLSNKTKRLVILCGSRHGLFLRQVVWQKQTNKRQKRNILVHISIQSNLAAAFSFTEIFIFTFSVAYGSCRCRCHIWSDFTMVPSSFVIPLFSHTLPKQTQKNAFPFHLLNIQLTRKRPMKTFANNSWMGLISFYSWKSS